MQAGHFRGQLRLRDCRLTQHLHPRGKQMDKPCLVATASLIHAAVDPPSWWRIIHEVASAHGFTVSRVRGPDRTFAVCAARQEAMWRIKRETPLTIQMIGRRFGRDHSTVVRSIERHERRVAQPSLAHDLMREHHPPA